MEDVRDSPPTIDIRLVGWIRSFSPTVRVFIDGECVGVVEDKLGQLFSLAPGVRKVMVMVNAMKSETWEVSMSCGNQVALECGFHHWAMVRFCLINLMLFAMPISNFLGLPLVGLAISLGVGADDRLVLEVLCTRVLHLSEATSVPAGTGSEGARCAATAPDDDRESDGRGRRDRRDAGGCRPGTDRATTVHIRESAGSVSNPGGSKRQI